MVYPANVPDDGDLTDGEARRIVAEVVAQVMASHVEAHADAYLDACRRAVKEGKAPPAYSLQDLVPIQAAALAHAQAQIRTIRGLDLTPVNELQPN